jgi:hypothetical protein
MVGMTLTFPDGTVLSLDGFGTLTIALIMFFVMLILDNAGDALRDVWIAWLKERRRNE